MSRRPRQLRLFINVYVGTLSSHVHLILQPTSKAPTFLRAPNLGLPRHNFLSNNPHPKSATTAPLPRLLRRKAMDTFFLSHGSPSMSIDESVPARHFLKSWRDKVMPPSAGPKPRAILMISAHWDTSEPSVSAVSGKNDTIYDFYGFPKPMYQLKYPAPGAPDLARRVQDLLTTAGFGPVHIDKKRGLDHGAWVPLMFMYPDADIPVCQLSVQSSRDGTYHYDMGRALAPLREEGVLVVGSGSATHNLRTIGSDGAEPPKWAREFDGWLCDAVVGGRYDEVKHYLQAAPHAKMAHPWPEHFFPLHVALGAAGEGAKSQLIHHSWTNQTLSYASFRFTPSD